jgi:hypothetical protein
MPPDFRCLDHESAGQGPAYPISSFTWLLLYETPRDQEPVEIMVEFF